MRIATTQQPPFAELKSLEASRPEHRDEVPQWHKDILDERHRAFEEGQIKAIDREEAKRQIEMAIR
jgi:hypothetical protein